LNYSREANQIDRKIGTRVAELIEDRSTREFHMIREYGLSNVKHREYSFQKKTLYEDRMSIVRNKRIGRFDHIFVPKQVLSKKNLSNFV
jgi:hypothetical protein